MEVDDAVFDLDDLAVDGIDDITVCIDRISDIGNTVSAGFQRACAALDTIVQLGDGHFAVSCHFNQTGVYNGIKSDTVSGDGESTVNFNSSADFDRAVDGESLILTDLDRTGIAADLVPVADRHIRIQIDCTEIIVQSLPGSALSDIENAFSGVISEPVECGIFSSNSSSVPDAVDRGSCNSHHTAVVDSAVKDHILLTFSTGDSHYTAVGNRTAQNDRFTCSSSGIEGTGVADRGIECSGIDVEDTACNSFIFFSCRIISRCRFGADGKEISSLVGGAVDGTESKFSTLTDDDIGTLAVNNVVGQAVNGKCGGDNFITALDHHVFGAVFSKSEKNLFNTFCSIGDGLAFGEIDQTVSFGSAVEGQITQTFNRTVVGDTAVESGSVLVAESQDRTVVDGDGTCHKFDEA